MAWPKGKPRPDAFKKKDTITESYHVPCEDKFTCECGNRMVETDYLNQLPGQAEYTCLKCDTKKIVDFTK